MPVRAEVVRRTLLDIEEVVAQLRAWLPITINRLDVDPPNSRKTRVMVEEAAQTTAGIRKINHLRALDAGSRGQAFTSLQLKVA